MDTSTETLSQSNQDNQTVSLEQTTSAANATQESTALPRDTKILATIRDGNGNKVGLDAQDFGQYVHNNYSSLGFMWRDIFVEYYDTHNMKEVREKLTAGMDAVSANYVALHDILLNLSRAQEAILLKKQIEWTDVDRQLFERYKQIKESNNFPFLNKVNLDWGSSFTNLYGLYDAEALVPSIFERINGKTVIDGGGFIGDTLFVWRHIFPDSKIHTFEPSSHSFAKLSEIAKKEIEVGNVVAVQKGLGDKPTTLKLNKNLMSANAVDAGASLKIDYNRGNFEEVEVITLDSYVAEHNLEVGLIKLDVEGFEPEIIKGALNTIKTQRPLLDIACYHTPEEFYELKSYLESLNLNYRFEIRRSTLTVPLGDLCLIAYPL